MNNAAKAVANGIWSVINSMVAAVVLIMTVLFTIISTFVPVIFTGRTVTISLWPTDRFSLMICLLAIMTISTIVLSLKSMLKGVKACKTESKLTVSIVMNVIATICVVVSCFIWRFGL